MQVSCYFFYNLYTYVINTLYKYSKPEIQTALKTILNNTTDTNVAVDKKTISLSKTAFDESVYKLQVVKNAGGGDCLFLAIAKALNDYNADIIDNNERITININNVQVGSVNSELFDTNNLRFIVWTYINNNPDEAVRMTQDAQYIYDRLMNIYNQESIKITGVETEMQWRVRIQNELEAENVDRYSLIGINPKFEPNKPFILKTDETTLRNFILSSNYWGDEFALNAIKETLGLVVIPIILNNNDIPNIVNINISNLGDKWNYYTFLYSTITGGGHWELMQFNYGNKLGNVSVFKKDILPVDQNSCKYIPPIYLIVLMFLLLYMEFDELDQKNVTFLNWAFKPLKEAYEIISNKELQNIDNDERNKLNNFFTYLERTFCYKGNKSNLCQNADMYKAKLQSLPNNKQNKTRKALKPDPNIDPSNIITSKRTTRKTIPEQSAGARPNELETIIDKIKKNKSIKKIVLVSTRIFPGTNKNPIHTIIEDGKEKQLGNNGYNSAINRGEILNPYNPIYDINTGEINQELVNEILTPEPIIATKSPGFFSKATSRLTSMLMPKSNTSTVPPSAPAPSLPENPPPPPPPAPPIPSIDISSSSSTPENPPPPPPIDNPSPSIVNPPPAPPIPSPSSTPENPPPPPPIPSPSTPENPPPPIPLIDTQIYEDPKLIEQLNKMIKDAKKIGSKDAFIPAAKFQVDNNLLPAIIGTDKNGNKLYLVNGKLNIDNINGSNNVIDLGVSTTVTVPTATATVPIATATVPTDTLNNDIEIIPFVPNIDPTITKVELEKIVSNKNTLVLFNENIFQYIAFHSGIGNKDGISSNDIMFGNNNDTSKSVSLVSTVIQKPKSNEEVITSVLRPLQVTNVRTASIPVGPMFNNSLDTVYMPLITKSAVKSLLSSITTGSSGEDPNVTAIKRFMPEKATIKNILEDAFDYIKKLVISGCYTKIYYIANQSTGINSKIYNGLEYTYNSGNNMPISPEVELYIMDSINKLTTFPINSSYSSCYTASTVADNEFTKFVVKPGADSTTSLLSNVKNESNLSYYMTVNLTLIPGDTKPEEMGKLNCKINEAKIKRYGAEILGLQNPILPLFQNGGKSKNNKSKNNKSNSIRFDKQINN